ncbi:hypothetical protein V2J09_018280 [Rumex salicifolius]
MTIQQFEANVRRQERERAAANLNTAISHLRSQLRQPLDACLQREQEHKQEINQLQEQEKRSSILVQTLRSTLADTKQQLDTSEKRVHQLETQILTKQRVSASKDTRVKELQTNIQRVTKELETEK